MNESEKSILDAMIACVDQAEQVGEMLDSGNIGLEPHQIRWGCMVILKWLRTEAIMMRIRPLELRDSSVLHVACRTLISASPGLRNYFVIRDNTLCFADQISTESAREMIVYAKSHYNPPLRT